MFTRGRVIIGEFFFAKKSRKYISIFWAFLFIYCCFLYKIWRRSGTTFETNQREKYLRKFNTKYLENKKTESGKSGRFFFFRAKTHPRISENSGKKCFSDNPTSPAYPSNWFLISSISKKYRKKKLFIVKYIA